MTPATQTKEIHYPDSDGRRVAENTVQADWIMTIFGNLNLLFANRPDVFVAMDNLWYPVEGNPKRRVAPDVYVVFGRPKGRRGSYQQWKEGGVPLHVVFEVVSPGNRVREMSRKFRFYERYGVEEYYIIDPDRHELHVSHRSGNRLLPVQAIGDFISPRLGIRFVWQPNTDVALYLPDGKPFLSFLEIGAAKDRVERELAASQSKLDSVEERVAVLTAKLRELGINPDTV